VRLIDPDARIGSCAGWWSAARIVARNCDVQHIELHRIAQPGSKVGREIVKAEAFKPQDNSTSVSYRSEFLSAIKCGNGTAAPLSASTPADSAILTAYGHGITSYFVVCRHRFSECPSRLSTRTNMTDLPRERVPISAGRSQSFRGARPTPVRER
jgi:hypothetical protein